MQRVGRKPSQSLSGRFKVLDSALFPTFTIKLVRSTLIGPFSVDGYGCYPHVYYYIIYPTLVHVTIHSYATQ